MSISSKKFEQFFILIFVIYFLKLSIHGDGGFFSFLVWCWCNWFILLDGVGLDGLVPGFAGLTIEALYVGASANEKNL
jgi:hypothetical protein